MRILKVIAGLGCLIAALFLKPWVSLVWGELWYMLVPGVLILGLIATGIFLILKRRQVMSKRVKILIVLFLAILVASLVASPALLGASIQHERKVLQARAKEFLSRPIPKLLVPDSQGYVGGYYVDTNSGPANGVFGYSLILIERYATNGRIRWSAAIQGQFACTGEGVNPNIRSDAINTNEEVRIWLKERNAILAKEWRMGFWQWIEDSIEFKSPIPEIEEEDQVSRFVQQLDGTWTNENSETMTISPNGTFSARWVSPVQTNIFIGTEFYRARDSILVVIRDRQSVFLQDGDKKEIRIIHVDSHNLIYELDGSTNSMSR